MKKLAIIVTHGMGSQGPAFADDIIEELEERLEDINLDPGDVAWKPIWWAPVLSKAQSDLWRRLRRGNNLDYKKLRKFIVHALGDAVAYRRDSNAPVGAIKTYDEIHSLIEKDVRELRKTTRKGKPTSAKEVPLLIIAHSLGGHIMSNHIWDLQKNSVTSKGNDFEDFKTLSGLITFGCNIPLFTLSHTDVQPIDFPLNVEKYFPSSTNLNSIKAATKWRNYYDPDDVLGWPLKPLSQAYGKAVHEDVDINVGNIFKSWNPISHSQYWTDNDFTKPVAQAIGKVLRLL